MSEVVTKESLEKELKLISKDIDKEMKKTEGKRDVEGLKGLNAQAEAVKKSIGDLEQAAINLKTEADQKANAAAKEKNIADAKQSKIDADTVLSGGTVNSVEGKAVTVGLTAIKPISVYLVESFWSPAMNDSYTQGATIIRSKEEMEAVKHKIADVTKLKNFK